MARIRKISGRATCLTLLLALVAPASARLPGDRVAWVTDGDTLRLDSGERIRIAGIDAPETHADQAHCTAEIARGLTAKAIAERMLLGRVVGVRRVGRSYRRTVAALTLDDRDVGTELVRRGAARWWPRYQPKPDWCALRR